ncbi:MAG: hypothetical protein COU07_02650 [Candidatus Harrisonbacteria bacterium CG10_big_fil_rev_8_21_14_0_10_40_38]|uniref:Uncharacterized protein n=1 Tax=Candidatus Harrisonbacteria bacterium CG10_big_fil_rev_8_21_14_0_10_40_38 TaxID=1974583 RepID=A0A2H0URR9_9BACT|nr:MAG: hypothetical protein COU07_02650 [Candidatus Harrisonbacteria bacterium CG10_big_fil_rev_8_21_14_0_10_40_38]
MIDKKKLFEIFLSKQGQSLAEILVAVTVALVLIGSSVLLIGVALRSSTETKYQQEASLLGHNLLNLVTVYAEGLWNCDGATCATSRGIYNLAKGSGAIYYIATTTPLTHGSEGSPEDITLNNATYSRYFYVQNMCRNGGTISGLSDNSGVDTTCVTSGGSEDPSTQKITAVVTWTENGTQTLTIEKILTHHSNNVFVQTDWSGGEVNSGGNPVVITEPDSYYFTDDSVNTGTAGEIKIQ